jgi:tRNA dimethylallyltransferase
VDPASAARIQPRDIVRLVRALEVYFLTGRPLTAHFAETVSPLPGVRILALLVQVPAAVLAARIDRRVAGHFARGLVDEVRGLLGRGVPANAPPFGSLGYRQVIEHLHGARDEAATRELVARETRQYARRQLIWFRKEPNLEPVSGPGELRAAIESAAAIVRRRFREPGV